MSNIEIPAAAGPAIDPVSAAPVPPPRAGFAKAGEDTDADGAIPAPRIAAASEAAGAEAPASTWITKEAGNRRLPFDRERLERSIDRVHAEFPQLDVADYKRSVCGFVERKVAVNADDLVDHLIREAEARVDVAAPEWEQFAARLYLH